VVVDVRIPGKEEGMTRIRTIRGLVAWGVLLLAAAGWSTALGKTGEGEAPPTRATAAPSAAKAYRYDYFDNFYSIAAGDRAALWIVGNSGRILHSPDAGKTWRVQSSGTEENLLSVSFLGPRKGWVCGHGGTILHTEDGGATWVRQTTGTQLPIFTVRFVNERTGFACGYFGLFLRTTDGGKTWENKSLGEDVTLRGMYFLNGKEGFLVGEFGTILRTDNGGSSFIRLNSPVPLTLFAVHFSDPKSGYAVGIDGTVLRTSDGGRSWAREESGVKDHLIGISGNDQVIVAVGLRGSMTARDKGGRWVPHETNTLNWLSGVHLSGGRQGYAVGAHGTILRIGEILDKGRGK
jgi:photosystem II stability/assembly factor-like uncharacterized protein